jgi:alkylhydroperoxidase/carboxymuconolactone decarboxylase family protein YurZ
LTTSLSLPIICDARCVEEQSENDRWQRGLEAYASQFGIEKSEVPQWFAERFGERFGREAITAAGGAWPDDALSLRDRSLVVVASLEHGSNRDELEALVTLLGVYVGFPKASAGMEIVRDELDQLGL